MNIRLVTVTIFVLIILGALGFFFMNEKNTKELTERISPTGHETQETLDSKVMVRSNDNRVSFDYPRTWVIADTTVANKKGTFGVILQSWSVSNVSITPKLAQSLPENVADITIEIEKGGGNLPLDVLIDCSMKTITCEKIGINNEQFIKAETMLNTGVKTITVATFYDDNILRAAATITPGTIQDVLTTQVNEILTSFTFSDNSPTNN